LATKSRLPKLISPPGWNFSPSSKLKMIPILNTWEICVQIAPTWLANCRRYRLRQCRSACHAQGIRRVAHGTHIYNGSGMEYPTSS
jgi:hypothetical protein